MYQGNCIRALPKIHCGVSERMKDPHGNYFYWLKRKDNRDDRLSKKRQLFTLNDYFLE